MAGVWVHNHFGLAVETPFPLWQSKGNFLPFFFFLFPPPTFGQCLPVTTTVVKVQLRVGQELA